jgi:hypothetical protein
MMVISMTLMWWRRTILFELEQIYSSHVNVFGCFQGKETKRSL